VFATASAVTRSFVVRPALPGRVAVTSVTSGDSQVVVGFTPPSNTGGTAILGYRLIATPNSTVSGAPVVVVDCAPVSPCVASGLGNGEAYTLTLNAYSAAGVGATSSAMPEFTPASAALSAVRDLRVTPVGESLEVLWTPPSSLAGGAFVRYEVSMRLLGDEQWGEPVEINDLTVGSFTFEEVEVGLAHEVRVVVISSALTEAAEDNTAVASVRAITAPEAPLRLTLMMLSPTSVRATWSPPIDDGGAPILEYLLSPSCVLAQPTNTYCVLQNLPRGMPITVRVAAANHVTPGQEATAVITLPAPPWVLVDGPPTEVAGPARPGPTTRPPVRPTPSEVPAPVVPTPRPRPTTPNATEVIDPASLPTFVPGGQPRAIVGGKLVEVATRVRPDGIDLAIGSVRLGFSAPTADPALGSLGGFGRTPDGNNTGGIMAMEGRPAAMRGEGLQPGSTVQIRLAGLPAAPGWGSSLTDRSLAQIPVSPEGSFDGQISLAGPMSAPPVPIGRHVVQIEAFDADGNPMFIESTITIAQHAPRPEIDRSTGEVPVARGGAVVATAAGLPTSVEIARTADGQGFSASGGDWSLGLRVSSGAARVDTGDSGVNVTVSRTGTFTTGGEGLQAGSRADIWLFSEPTLLGTTIVEIDGTFTFDVEVNAEEIGAGLHTMQVQGVAPDGYVRSVNLGVNVDESLLGDDRTGAGAGEPSKIGRLIPGALFIASVVMFFMIWRRRRKEEDELDIEVDMGVTSR
jgi:hypothetical protein